MKTGKHSAILPKELDVNYHGKSDLDASAHIIRVADLDMIIAVSLHEDEVLHHYYDPQTRSLDLWYQQVANDDAGSMPVKKFLVPKNIKEVNIYDAISAYTPIPENK